MHPVGAPTTDMLREKESLSDPQLSVILMLVLPSAVPPMVPLSSEYESTDAVSSSSDSHTHDVAVPV